MINVLASGSSGNAYYVGGDSPLLLEAGIPFRRIQQGLNFKTSQLAGCLISHEHQDHSKAVREMMKAGIDIYLSEGTAAALKLTGHRVHVVKATEQFQVGGWQIKPFPTVHDAAEPLGFLLANQSGDKVLYATDTEYIPNRFRGLTHILVECNYSKEIVKRLMASGELDMELWRRIINSHMSLETVEDFLKANDLSQVQEIWLLHLSDNNSDADLFKQKIMGLTGKVVKIA